MRSTLTPLHHLRAAEVESVMHWFSPPMRVLELGGRDGFQAKLLSEHGCDVSSIDVSLPRNEAELLHPVILYDGAHIPFADGTFDAVFSSNVLEHVKDLPRVLAEVRRVSRPNAVGVHLVPSATWRFWTMTSHFPWLVRRLTVGRAKQYAPSGSPVGGSKTATPIPFALKALGLAPHGENPSSLHELYYFSRPRWRDVFTTNGFDIAEDTDNSLFYTGHLLLPALSIPTRRRMASVLGASCHVFVVRSNVR